ncbi:hypothetical protein NDU88_003430 [Pleurodeles waltl]|uniref:Uncharacterized protein n=1 Tax=Pleurodeles waltl TaxID=8319 RepID=A0AAV7SDG4_PLEWA|nr:hypothetical protein NDU88_003430 [Pleurodeles waltl]
MPVAWAVQGPPGAPRHPFPPSWFWRWTPPETGWQEGGRNPHGGAASSAAMAGSLGQRETSGKPPAPLFRPRLYRRGQNRPGSTASLLAVLPPHSATAVMDRQGQNDPHGISKSVAVRVLVQYQ